MKKEMATVLLAILVVTFLTAAAQELEEQNIKLNGAIVMGNIDEVKRLVKAGVDINKKFDIGENRGFSALILAAHFGRAEIGKVLIDAGADINEKTSDGLTLLHCIAQSPAGNKAVTELLIAKGADVNAKGTRGETPLDLAISKGNKELVDLLRKHRAVDKRKF